MDFIRFRESVFHVLIVLKIAKNVFLPPSAQNVTIHSIPLQKENAYVLKGNMWMALNVVNARKDAWSVLELISAQIAMAITLWMEGCAKKMD